MGKMGKNKKRPKKNLRSSILDKQTSSYYENVLSVINGEFEFDGEESKASCINAVLKAISEEGLKVSQDQTVSIIVEKVLQFADHNQLQAIFNNFSLDWELACCDRSASFVTQSLLLYLNKYLGDELSTDGEEKSVSELMDELFLFMKPKVAFYMQHVSASHVLRVLIEVLAGCQMSDVIIRGKQSQQREAKKIQLKKPPKQYLEKLTGLCSSIINLPKLEDHVRNNLSNPVLQTVLLSMKSLDSEVSSSLCCQLMSNAKVFHISAENDLPENLTHEIGSRLVEQFLMTVPDDVYKKIWKKYFRGHLLDIAKHPVANFVLQKLILQSKTDQQLEEMFGELSSELETVLAMNHFGIVVALTESSVQHKSMQATVIKSLQLAFHCDSPPERQCKLVPLLMALTTYEVFYQLNALEDKESDSSSSDDSSSESNDEAKGENEVTAPKVTAVNYHGSLVIQNLLKFTNNRPIINSLFELKQQELKNVCCDPCGSYIIEVFLNSVKGKSLEMLYNKLKNIYFDLACNKCGSRTFDALWNHATVDQKFAIAEELAKHESRLKGNHFGKFIYHKCSIAHLKQRPGSWRENQEKQDKLAKKRKIQEVVLDSGKEKPWKNAKLKFN